MSRKYLYDEKLKIVEGYLNGDFSLKEKATALGYNSVPGCFKLWVQKYREHGATALLPLNGHNTYSKEFKVKVVEEYLRGRGSLFEIVSKYKLSNDALLSHWISIYNANRELEDYSPKREVYMAQARRKTTIEERKEIVDYCIKNNRNYKETAALYDISYSQVYSWVKKYDSDGEDALTDKRGCHKTDDEVDELERLRRENLRLKRQLEEKDMLTELLKKVNEFERM